MMTASREITVYSSDGLNRIGVLQRGEEVLTLGDTGAGTVVAYIIGLVKNEDKAALLTQDEWEKAGTAADRLCAFAQAQVDNGSIYVLGAQGQTGGEITEAWIKMREHNDTANTKRAVALWKKRLAAGYAGLRAFDCSGLVIRHLPGREADIRDKNANGIYYDLCDPIDKTALSAGDLVFKKYLTNSRMYHVGVYMGDNTVVHAKGRDDGVVREAISKTGWEPLRAAPLLRRRGGAGGLLPPAQEHRQAVYERRGRDGGAGGAGNEGLQPRRRGRCVRPGHRSGGEGVSVGKRPGNRRHRRAHNVGGAGGMRMRTRPRGYRPRGLTQWQRKG